MTTYEDGVEIEFDPERIDAACAALSAAAEELASGVKKVAARMTESVAPWGEHIQQDAPTARDAVTETLGIETPVEMPKVAPIFQLTVDAIGEVIAGMSKIASNLTGRIQRDINTLRDTTGQHTENQELAVAAVDSIDSNIAGAK